MTIARSLRVPASSPHGPPHAEARAFAAVAAESGHPVLITGETGSGKTHLARLIHESGPRAGRPFVRVNCAAIPESLFEREMFGHVRGAFTDAREGADGFLAAADGGTLFLDEISEMPLQTQPKLLAVLEDGCFRRLGSTREMQVDVQVVAATNRDLAAMVSAGGFREDLFYRISVLRHAVPPLRARPEEIPALVDGLLARAARAGAAPPEVSPEAMEVLMRHAWPGNVRELDNALRAAAVFARGGPILPVHLPAEVRQPAVRLEGPERVPMRARALARYAAPEDPDREARMIRMALEAHGGNKTQAARRLGMSRSTLWAKLQRYAL
jgi:DNA-binding NtrC family response regulator